MLRERLRHAFTKSLVLAVIGFPLSCTFVRWLVRHRFLTGLALSSTSSFHWASFSMLVTFPPPISTLFRKSTPRKACTCDGRPRDVVSDRQLFGPTQPSFSHSLTLTLSDRGRHRLTETGTQKEAGRHTLGVGHTLALPLALSHGQRQSVSCTARGWLCGTGESQQSKYSSDQYRASVIRWHLECDRFSRVHTVSVSLPLAVCGRRRPRRALGNFPARFSTDGGESL